MKVRYVEFDPEEIFNFLDPMNITCWVAFPEWHDNWWNSEIVSKRKLFGEIWMQEFDALTKHFSQLEESILKEGILSPISTVTGPPRDKFLQKVLDVNMFPPSTQGNINDVVYTHTFGGSRLTIAKRHCLQIPCIIYDFSDNFPTEPEVTSRNYTQWFKSGYMWASTPPYVRVKQHSHLKEGQFTQMNDNTRKAQQTASDRAKKKIYDQYSVS